MNDPMSPPGGSSRQSLMDELLRAGVPEIKLALGDAIDRENARRHLSFGYGVHRCVGARLAELQLRILLEEMAARRMRVTVTGEPERVHACFVHGFRALPVQIEKY